MEKKIAANMRIQILGPLPADMLQMQLDFSITSLFGKMGVAEIEYKVASYKEGVIEIRDCSDPLKFW